MKVKIQVVIENDEGQVEDVQQVACLRRGPLTPEELGLNLAEARQRQADSARCPAIDGHQSGRRIH